MQGPASPAALPRYSASMLPIDADPAEKDLVRLLERALAPSFTLVQRIGAGGMGSVYLARDPVLKRLVAVKVMAPTLASDPDARARFEREAQSVASISHPNVVAVYSVGELENGVPYLVMQYVEGRTMAERIAQGGPLEAPTARRVLGEVASALAAAHRKGIIHRDIKPSNILWDDETGRSLVTDFGIAAAIERADTSEQVKLTHTGMAIGTPMYMSPEQLLAEPVTEKTDIYSIGLLGYELLIGEGPYKLNSPHEAMAAHLRDTPRRLSSMRGDVDAELERLLEECLSKDPAGRPTASEVEGRLMHGASILLEWPPPGLEPLHARFRSTVRVLGLGAALVGVPLVLLSVFDRDSYVRQLLPPMEFLLSIVTLGFVLFAAGCFKLVRFLQSSARAVDMGYRWGTIAEVVGDERGDSGALIAGAREYATLTPPQRSSLRRRRILAAALLLAAAFMPVLGFAIGVVVSARYASGPTIVLWASLVLALTLMTAWGVVQSFENRLLRAARARRTALSSVRQRPAELAAAWTETFEQVREGQSLGAGPAGKRTAVMRAGVTVAAFAVLAALLGNVLVLIATMMTVLGEVAVPKFSNTREKIQRVQRLDRYVLPPDPTMSPQRAAQALHSISRAGGSPPANVWEAEPAIAIPAHIAPAEKPPFGDSASLADAFRQAPRGFSDAQRTYLTRLANNPALAEFRLAAAAPALDLGVAVWNVPPESRLSWHELPIIKFTGLRGAAASNTAQAALDLAAGRRVDAERRLREVISVGFLLMRDGRTLLENLVGAAIVIGARNSLAAFYEVTGRGAESRFVSSASDPGSDARLEIEASRRVAFEEMMRSVRRTVLDTTEMRGLRWELLLSLYSLAPCSDMRQILFGVDSTHRATLDEARRSLVRGSTDSLLFAFVEQPMDTLRMTRGGTPLIGRSRNPVMRSVSIVTGHRTLEACAAMLGIR